MKIGDINKIKEQLGDLLQELVEVPGVTGFEDGVRQKIASLLQPAGAQTSTDHTGNLYATIPGQNGGDGHPHVMFCAHMDEVGFVVNNIDPDGFIYLYPLGGIPDYLGPGEWVALHTEYGKVYGSIGIHPPHLPVSGRREIFVDIGVQSRDQVLQTGISVGTPVTFSHNFQRLYKNRVMGRCLDDRMGCAALVLLLRELAKNRPRVTVTGVFSSTEEHGMLPGSGPAPVQGSRGAMVAAMKLRPGFAVVVDSMVCSDIPGIPPHLRQIRLGGGVALRLVDDLAIMRPQMRAFLKKVAAGACITVQEGISRSYTDASVIQLADVPVATLGIPLRYAHSPAQVADLGDIAQTCLLMEAIVQNADQFRAV
jgi:endoglucanase